MHLLRLIKTKHHSNSYESYKKVWCNFHSISLHIQCKKIWGLVRGAGDREFTVILLITLDFQHFLTYELPRNPYIIERATS